MKVYVASSFLNIDHVRSVMQMLTDAGHEITHDWTQEDPNRFPIYSPEWVKYREECGAADRNGVMDCDLFVFLVHPKSKDSFTEFGMALAWRKPIVVVDSSVNHSVFMGSPSVVKVDFPADVLSVLEGIRVALAA